tara:strand:- start:580 stop:720 length:141 start_codon:yes stop_codon:yes gene_type:complete
MKQELNYEHPIVTPIYYYEDNNGNKIIDKECMREEFEYEIQKLDEL